MSRLLEVTHHVAPDRSRHEFEVVLDPTRIDAGLDPAELLDQCGAVANRLASTAAGRLLEAVTLDHLEVRAPVQGGDRLVVTAALEPSNEDRFPVSLVARRSLARGPGVVVALGVLVFSPPGHPNPSPWPRRRADGRSPIETHFHARRWGRDWLTTGNLVSWVHSSSMLSAQGFAGGPLTLEVVEGLSVLGPLEASDPVVLTCSVVESTPRTVTVLSHLEREANRQPVLCSLTRWRREDAT